MWVALALVGLSACSDEDKAEYTPADAASTAEVYFPSTNSSSLTLSTTATTFSVPVNRVNTDQAISVPVTVTGNDGNYTVPSTVDFAQGASSSSLTISYDADAVGFENYTELTFSLGEGYTSPYGLSSYTLTVGIPAPWVSLGTCTFVEDFITTFWGVSNIPYEVEIQENQLQPGYFRLVNAFGGAYPYNDDGDYDDSQDYYLEIHAEDPDAVYIGIQNVGMDWGYGEISVGSFAGYYIERKGSTLAEVKEEGYTGTYKDGVITFPTNSLLVGMADYNSGGLYKANTNGAFKVVMPGIVLADYSVEVAYAGKYTDATGADAGVIANIVSVGEDVDMIRLAIVEGTDTDKAYELVRSERVAYVDIDPTTTQALVPFNETPVDGKYTLVAISYASKVAQEASYATVKYVSSAAATETWTALYVGDYTYTLFFGEEDDPAVDEGLVLYQSDKDPNRFKIEHWGYDVDFIFSYDEENGIYVVEEGETGYTYGDYGMVMVDEYADYFDTTDYGYSYYSNGTFHFNLVYYVEAGYFAYGEETFTLTGYADETRAVNTAKAVKGAKTVKSSKAPKFSRMKMNKNAKVVVK